MFSRIHWCLYHVWVTRALTRGASFSQETIRLPFYGRVRGGSDAFSLLGQGPNSNHDDKVPSIQAPQIWTEPKRALVLMDVFSEYHGIYLSHQAREAYGVATVSVLSDYMKGYFEREATEELDRWKREFMPDDGAFGEWMKSLEDLELVAISCESDSGLADAERFGNKLNLTYHNGFNEARRNKFQMIEAVREAGLAVVRQRLCANADEAIAFAQEIGVQTDGGDTRVVVKPVRGVASDDVHLCKDLSSVKEAFDKIHGSSVFGSPSEKHDAVLLQEFAEGQEFAIDVVCKDGEKKVAAIWIYDKRPANGAPFVYYATEVYDGDQTQTLYEYVSKTLDALGVRWGMTHNEVIVTKDGPRLVEVNCRQHNMDFIPITMGCFGYNAFDMLLAAYLGDLPPIDDGAPRLRWDLLPHIPAKRMNGQMVHLSSFVSGRLRSVNEEALMEIQQMESVVDLEVYGYFLQPGNPIRKTVDIRTDCGWVQMVHPDSQIFQRDFNRIIELMPTIFDMEEDSS